MHTLGAVLKHLHPTEIKYVHIHLKYIKRHTLTCIHHAPWVLVCLPTHFPSSFMPSRVICAARESHENHWSILSSTTYYMLETKATVNDKTRGSSNVKLIDYLKGCSDLVNTQALLDTHPHSYIKEHAWLFDVFFYPILHQSNISFKECVLLDKHMLIMAMCHSKWLNYWIIEVSCTFVFWW